MLCIVSVIGVDVAIFPADLNHLVFQLVLFSHFSRIFSLMLLFSINCAFLSLLFNLVVYTQLSPSSSIRHCEYWFLLTRFVVGTMWNFYFPCPIYLFVFTWRKRELNCVCVCLDNWLKSSIGSSSYHPMHNDGIYFEAFFCYDRSTTYHATRLQLK